MKIITCASYYGSGSSALTDLVSEYSDVKDLSDYEFRFLHCLDGVSDLEYNLVTNHNRINSGHAIKRFEKMVLFNSGNVISKRYSKFFDNNDYQDISYEYIEKLIDFKYKGLNFYDLYDRGPKLYYFYQFMNKLSKKTGIKCLNLMKNEELYCSHKTEAEFLDITKNYMSRILGALNKDNLEYIEMDQLVPSSNIDKYMRYINEPLYVFVVDRDPRDVYLLAKYVWKDDNCPTDVQHFCDWFEYTRNSGEQKDYGKNVLKLQFEELIYRYDDVVSSIEKITGLRDENHIFKFKKFNPMKSVNNTRLWDKYPDDENITYIEKHLAKYLYDYSDVDINKISGIPVENKGSF